MIECAWHKCTKEVPAGRRGQHREYCDDECRSRAKCWRWRRRRRQRLRLERRQLLQQQQLGAQLDVGASAAA